MSSSRHDHHARRAQIRGRRIVAGVVGAIVIVLVIVGIGAAAGWFKSSTPADKTATAPSAAKAAANNRAAALTSSGAWPTFGNTPGNTRANTSISSALPLRTLWTADTGRLIELPPVIGDGRVVVANYGYGLAYDLTPGRGCGRSRSARHRRLTGADRPAGDPERGESQRAIFATRPDTSGPRPGDRRPIWTVALGSSVETSPLVLGDGVFVGTRAGDVVRISLASAASSGRTGPAVRSRARSPRRQRHRVRQLRRRGQALIRRTARSPGGCTPSGFRHLLRGGRGRRGRIYIGNTNGSVLGWTRQRSDAWTAVTGGYVYSSPAVADGLVFMGSYDHNLYALNAARARRLAPGPGCADLRVAVGDRRPGVDRDPGRDGVVRAHVRDERADGHGPHPPAGATRLRSPRRG